MKKPNIVVFMTDQQNADTIKPNSGVSTPNVDAFRKDATTFTQAYTVSPHCCPSRASFFTSLYPSMSGVWNNVEVDNSLRKGLYDGVTTFPELLQDCGYRTVFSGKWHVSAYEGPQDRGFDTVLHEYISNYGRTKQSNTPSFNDWKTVYADKQGIKLDTAKDFGEIVRLGYPKYFQFGSQEDPFGDKITVSMACRFIHDYDSKEPFFLFVSPTGPHDPYCPPQEFLDLYKREDMTLPDSFSDSMEDKPALYRRTRKQFDLTQDEELESTRHYRAFVSFEDSLFGSLIDSLKRKDLYKDTVIVYLTDHGDYLGAHGLWAKGLPCFREAYQICALMKVPSIPGGKTNDALVSITDFAPTILALAGARKLDGYGRSLLPLMECSEPEDWRTELYSQTNGNEVYGIQRAVWNRSWKYVFNSFDFDELYDLEQDPYEMHNLATKEEYQPVIKDMCRKMWSFAKENHDNCTCPYIMVGLAPYGPGIILE